MTDTLADRWERILGSAGGSFVITNELIEETIAALRLQQWVSVAERLPEYGDQVLIVERFSNGQAMTSCITFDPRTDRPDVECWMPLPAPPEVE